VLGSRSIAVVAGCARDPLAIVEPALDIAEPAAGELAHVGFQPVGGVTAAEDSATTNP
jgi:hypothetical protein